MRLVEYLILASIAGVGYAGLPAWWVLPATAVMTAAGWWRKVGLLRQHPQVPFSIKMRTYFVVGIILDLCLASACYAAGRGLRWWLLA
jgi:hypothetical protein